ncbi:hypothetical protein COW36_22110 [bacterium (Candidatus Blackallbacteria) CG17_big_fil_post_rev_8_21_14_2_50_48_46]|uniref:RND efflux pump membrane fusion protein barrel-sandwich domain-containing protein n=1 Tax=bacterium (Candidatus Blackallbacteria) CG17_big_fil_post_rev_8_21_14_2_50_48_46 TaxID=2014261 RepID=A0A2M7FZK7_9BACT|nr:MAG: hypothetical protein COW64_13540 [bacterium (Candidatus Blackallbacteria) CG18_big_fil_WC_8_21_14_2_50_49_26]PIW14313.1 MAG: hypothetical protein COW36_22110 [bacterium (Candidatus Blackallbacteria) CG17_big_fil_post_rev_8_21_14_2_50_48_46]PIW45582.1 MAG: hypothetical protein COW20_19715 [bacterium (Candidatus Blackallbacteria) CG13_big_fil_rev_8_21_14_2_50_49_14]
MKDQFRKTLLLACSLLVLSACPQEKPKAEEQTAPPQKTQGQELKLSAQAIANAKLELLQAGPKTLRQIRDFPGKIALDEHRVQAISSRVSGVAELTDKHIGQRIRQGDLLAVIESRELADLRLDYLNQQKQTEQAKKLLQREENLGKRIQQLIQALRKGGQPESIHQAVLGLQIGSSKSQLLTHYSRLRLAQTSFERENKLAQDQLSTSQELQQARQELEAAKAQYIGALEDLTWQRENTLLEHRQTLRLAQSALESAQAKLQTFGPGGLTHLSPNQMTRYEIRSPLSGVVVEKNVTEGQGVMPDAPLYKVADLSEVWAEIQIYESELDHIRLGQQVMVRADGLKQSAPGQITHVKPLVDEVSRSAEAHAHIANPGLIWRPGMYVTIQVTEGTWQVPLAVKRQALQQLEGKTVIFIKQGERFLPREIKTGREDGQSIEILAGLKAGDIYVGKNSFVLKSALLTAQEE